MALGSAQPAVRRRIWIAKGPRRTLARMKAICVFCGSSTGDDPAFEGAARHLGELLVDSGCSLVYGGGSVGLMGVLADTVLARGGQTIGVIPRMLWDREVGHRGLSDLRIVETMHERKALMAELSDGFIAMPGGIGTLDEFFEIWTWAQLGVHRKPCGVFNVAGYFDPMLAMIDNMIARKFLRPEYRGMVIVESELSPLLARMASYDPPNIAKWLDRGQI